MSLSPNQERAIEITERASSVFSICGALFVIGTYLASSAFHKPINRMVFYAAWGNMITNIATLISLSGILAGANSSLCQSQGFIIQMFMPADSLWTLAMAFNVYLTFRHRYSASQLRSLEWKYILLCYGIPFIPAVVYLFVHTEARGRIYGPADLWCWVSIDWDVLRIAIFYGPVWMILLVTLLIYVVIGAEIYRKRKQLRNLLSSQNDTIVQDTPVYSKTVEVQITSQEVDPALKEAQGYPPCVVNGQATYQATTTTACTSAQAFNTSNSDAAAWAYTKVALLFFIALLITWVPSTINRLYTLVQAGAISFALNYFESLVLPLQGFWNATIYVATSMSACRTLWESIRGRSPVVELTLCRMRSDNYVNRKDDKSESMTELADQNDFDIA